MTISGECVSAARRSTVRIASLGSTGCEVRADRADGLPEGEFALWIGAIGPLPATPTHRDGAKLSARFAEPLDPRILAHFGVG